MKRVAIILSILLIVAVLASSMAVPVAAADSASYADPYAAFQEFATVYAVRTVGTDYEKGAAKYLADALVDMGYVAEDGSADADKIMRQFTFTYQESDDYYTTTDVSKTSYNVVAYKRSSVADAPLLVLAAPYSNEKDYTISGEKLGYEDAAYSASSVGALLSIAFKIMNSDLSYDVAIAFMGAEFFYSAGTDAFLAANEQTLLGAVYLSQVGVGDHLNVYYDEVSRTYGDYIDDLFARYRYDVRTKPFDAGYSVQIYGGDLPYSHIGISGGNYHFLQKGVPAVHLFGYNWTGGLNNGESSTYNDLVFTANDTYDNFVKVYGKETISARLQLTVDAVTTLVLSPDLAQTMTQSRSDASYRGLVSDAAYQAFRWCAVGVAVLAAVIVALLLLRRSKAAGTPDFSVNSDFMEGAKTTDGDNVFGEFDPIRGEEGSVDSGEESTDDKDDNTGAPPDTNDIFGEF